MIIRFVLVSCLLGASLVYSEESAERLAMHFSSLPLDERIRENLPKAP